jgi:hypothetical protein
MATFRPLDALIAKHPALAPDPKYGQRSGVKDLGSALQNAAYDKDALQKQVNDPDAVNTSVRYKGVGKKGCSM